MSVDKRANLNMDRTLKNRIEANVREVLSSVSTFAVIPEMENLLVAIDDRLRSIEATCDGRLATLTRKIDYLDGKVSRIETMAGVEIDKIAENMSAKNFKDDIINTNVFKRIDVVYEGLLHRLAYLGAKVDNKFAKLQLTLDATQLRLTKLEQTLITRDSDIESELSFILSSTDDVKTTCLGMEQHILNEQQQLTNQSNSHTESVLKAQLADVNHELGIVNVTATQTLMHMEQVEKAQRELFEEANAYANKMADMFVQQWQQALRMETAVKRLDEAVAGARTESQNSLRALALQLGKVVAKEATGEGAVLGGCGEVKLSHLQETMEKNFEELFLKQDLLLEKLQMDESNMEAKISEMFERLIDTIEKKIIMTPRDIKNVEQLVKNLGNNARKNLQLIGNNVNYLLDKVDDCNAYIDGSVFGQLSKIQNMCNLTDSNTNLTIEPNVITNKNEAINTIMDKMTELEERNDHLMENLAKATKLAEKRDTIQMVTKLENLLQAYEKLETLFKNPKPTNNMKPLFLYKTESEIPDIPLISYQTKPELTATPTTTAEDELTDTTSTTSFTSDSRTV